MACFVQLYTLSIRNHLRTNKLIGKKGQISTINYRTMNLVVPSTNKECVNLNGNSQLYEGHKQYKAAKQESKCTVKSSLLFYTPIGLIHLGIT